MKKKGWADDLRPREEKNELLVKNGDEGERKLNTIGGVTGKREVEVMVMVAEEDEDARRRDEIFFSVPFFWRVYVKKTRQ